ncbi:MAG: hypothetical protein EKK53_21545 [Burkholderiales bacterium]|nr:MAG: hypothetical protein EKK53_21545 [Burkholderiales bacterium]
MSTETTTKSMTAEERRRLWDEVAAEEASGITTQAAPAPAAQAATADAVQAAQSASQTQPVEQTGQTAQTDAQPVDKFAGLPSEVRDYMAGLQAQVEQLAGRVRSTEGSIGGLKSAMQRQREAAQAVRESGGAAPTEAQIKQAQAGGQRAIDKLKDTYPEFAEQLDAVLKEELAAVRAIQQPQPQEQQPQAQALSRDEEIAVAKREAYIEGKGFKGWQQQIQQPEFVGWFNRQPREVQMLGHSPNWDDAVRLLELHRQEQTARQQPGAQRGLESFAGVSEIHRSGQSAQRGIKSVDQMTPAEYWAHLSEQERQQNQQRG